MIDWRILTIWSHRIHSIVLVTKRMDLIEIVFATRHMIIHYVEQF